MTTAASTQAFALHIVQTLQQAGFTAYWAGGCVRDRLMGRPPKDYDIATAARPEDVLRLFPRSQKIGAAFGVVLVRHKQLHVEVATFREDGNYSDGRHPDTVRFTSPEEDARRRDFTCNGLFFDPLAPPLAPGEPAGLLHDFIGGQRDIHAKILRAIGDPRQRFAEDHLRMLRAIRFAARLDFTIDPATHQAIADLQRNIDTISRERIGEEIRMMLEHPSRLVALSHLAAFPTMFQAVFGFPPARDAADRDWPCVSGLPAAATRAVVLMAILSDEGVAAPLEVLPTLRTRLVLSNDETAALNWFAEKLPLLDDWEDLSRAALKRLMADPRWHGIDALFRADPANADQLLAFNERIATLQEEGVAPAPYITGNMLIQMGATPNPRFKQWLDTLYDRQLNGDFATQDDAVAAARQLLTES